MVNSFKVVREALVTHGESVSDRPDLPLQEEIAHGKGEDLTGEDLNSVILTEKETSFCVHSQLQITSNNMLHIREKGKSMSLA